ncbi:sulfurtransferase [Pandoraea cepalis]|uniref:Sulfurtransferase n=1 Tax=Pandoraea cepalis TaxID=2508294 RepID=A0AAW7MSH5_9BURK|nr:rhodanese-like domain-containing protein [Pandoraea cepalis]MDN4575803.1 sulfurtransferase [Pandoraea cepalis]MDN4580905.1 sulfurtransferase [Pandoraea cepalis]
MTFFTDYTNLALIAIALVSGGMLAWPVFKRGGRGLSTVEATQLINRKGAVVLDVRSGEEFAAGHLPSARNLPFDDVEQKVGQVIKNKAAPVLIVCKNGQGAARVQTLLRGLGYAEAFSLQGGIATWQEAGLPVVK